MSGTNALVVDTNIIIYLFNGDRVLDQLLNQRQLFLSSITEIELLSYPSSKEQEKIIRNFIAECNVVELHKSVKEHAIELRKKHKLKLPDSIIAATAWFIGLPLVSSDTDFKRVEEIELFLYQKSHS